MRPEPAAPAVALGIAVIVAGCALVAFVLGVVVGVLLS